MGLTSLVFGVHTRVHIAPRATQTYDYSTLQNNDLPPNLISEKKPGNHIIPKGITVLLQKKLN